MEALYFNQVLRYRYPVKKDYTDSELAIKFYLENYPENIKINSSYKDNRLLESLNHSQKPFLFLVAAFGNRYDHLFSNQLLAEKYASDFDFLLTDGACFQFVLQNQESEPREIQLNFREQSCFHLSHATFSLLSLSDKVENISIENAEYSLMNQDLHRGQSLGLSNIPQKDKKNKLKNVRIRFGKGCLAIFVLTQD